MLSVSAGRCVAIGCESSGVLPVVMLAVGVLLVLGFVIDAIRRRRS